MKRVSIARAHELRGEAQRCQTEHHHRPDTPSGFQNEISHGEPPYFPCDSEGARRFRSKAHSADVAAASCPSRSCACFCTGFTVTASPLKLALPHRSSSACSSVTSLMETP